MVRRGHDLEAPVDHARRIRARLRHRFGCRNPDRLLVRAAAAGGGGVRSLRQDDQRAAAGRAGADLRALARPRHLVEGRPLGMSERALLRHVYWPSALSWMFSSLHTSVGFAVVGAVVGEYLGSAAGLGYLIQQAEGVFDVAGVFAGMLVLAAFVIGIDFLV